MNALQSVITLLARPYISHELPGWGKVYERLVGGYEHDAFWATATPCIIRDKHANLLRLLDLRKWSDRSFFFLKRWYDLPTALTIDLIVREGDTVVDVGANYGHFSLLAAIKAGETGRVLAFEPNPVAFSRLQTHIDLNHLSTIRAQNVGLSDRAGELELNVPDINSGEASFTGTGYSDATTVSCPVLVGDDAIGETTVSFIKIDVEGFEYRVLKGLEKTIERDRPWIITEIVKDHLCRDGRTPADLDDLLRPIGYAPMRIALQGRGSAQNLSLTDFKPDKDEIDCDVLWVPESRREILSSALAGSGKRSHS